MKTDNGCVAFQSGAPPNKGGTFSNNIVDGSDRTGTSGSNAVCYGIYHDWPDEIQNNVFQDLVNPLVGGANSDGHSEVSGNLINNCLSSAGGANHNNCVESFFGGTVYIHDNVINMNNPNNAGETMFLGTAGETDYIWNNIIYNITGNGPETEFRDGTVSQYWYNNTIVNIVGGNCIGSTGSDAASHVTVINNHCIGGGLPSNGGVYSASNNITQSAAQADSNSSPHFDQYTSLQAFVYGPVVTTNSTVGAGANLTTGASWPPFSTNSTNYACIAESVNGVMQVVCPAKGAVGRPTSGPWDVGAYLLTGQAPDAPTNLQASVQ